ncbi:MAG: serine/threonine protein kinase [Verrucomicrobiales bacterium]|jgi:serine/threonine protein kinase
MKPEPDILNGLEPTELIEMTLTAAAGAGPFDDDDDLPDAPGFEIIDVLGRGGMGEVFRARQLSLGREVALKRVPEQKRNGDLFTMADERFRREASVLGQLNHPNVVSVFDYLELPGGGAALILELVEGGTLQQLLDRDAPLPVDDALALIRQIGAGLAAAHDAGIIHRDLKPANVLLTPLGVPKVSDFGLADLATVEAESGERLTLTGLTMGTPGSMAPEQLSGERVDLRADIYSLGVLAYELLTGERPQGNFEPPPGPPEVKETVLRALRPKPEDRFATVHEFLAALPSSNAKPSRRKWLTIGLGFAAAAAAAGGGVWLDGRDSGPKLAPAPADPNAADWTDLLADIEVSRDQLFGDWERDGDAIVSRPPLEWQPQALAVRRAWDLDSYELRLRFQRLSGVKAISVFFPSSHGFGNFEFSPYEEPLAGFQWIDGLPIFGRPTFSGRPPTRSQPPSRGQPPSQQLAVNLIDEVTYELVLSIQPEQLSASLGEKKLVVPMTNRKLTVEDPWKRPGISGFSGLAIGSWGTTVRFESLAWR